MSYEEIEDEESEIKVKKFKMNFVDFLNDLYVGIQDTRFTKEQMYREINLKKQAGYYDNIEVKNKIDEMKKSILVKR